MKNHPPALPLSFNRRFFLFQACKFDGQELEFIFGDTKKRYRIAFRFVRSFLKYKESDGFPKINVYDTEKIFGDESSFTGIYELKSGAILSEVFGDCWAGENPSYYWVSTPDECFEVVAFERPSISGV